MPIEAKCRIFKRKDGKYLLYLPLALVQDSQFPFKPIEEPDGGASIRLKIRFEIGKKRLIVEPLDDES